MNLKESLQETGCAIFVDGQCTTSVERLSGGEYLLMTRRGVSILQFLLARYDDLVKRYEQQQWQSARVVFVGVGYMEVIVPKNSRVTAQWTE